ncbi:hypothetical protein SUGI_0201200 [Cryptomeria japonica]|nr:hypothetical protein SUGI_0201200 [Cryptomeria japonica]
MARACVLPSAYCLASTRDFVSLNGNIAVCVSIKFPGRRFSVKCTMAEVAGESASPSAQTPRRVVGRGSKLIGSGSAVPKLLVSNDDLSKLVETSDEWISVRTGIRNRRILSGDETLTSLAVESSRKALEMAKVKPEDVHLVLMCTSSPDDLFGSAPQVQRDLGCTNALAFDITAACSGFVLGLVTATRFIKGGGFDNILVIGADALSRYVDWTDRGTCILFGDAAGAVLLQAADGHEDGLLGFDLHSDGHGQKHLSVAVKGSGAVKDASSSNGAALVPPSNSSYSCIQMNGKEVFRFAVRCVPQTIEAAMEEAGLTASHLDWLLLHQANQRIISAVSERLHIEPDRVISNLADYGFGAGLTWGSAIVRWG